MPLYARYSDLLSGDTVSITAGSEDAAYPKENVIDRLSRTVGKFTGTSGTYRRTFSGSKTVEAAVFVNTNATAITLSNNSGLSQVVTIPTTPEDGLTLDPWIDLRTDVNNSATQWNAALTGPAGVGLGEFILISSLRDINVLWTPSPVEREGHPVSHQETDYGVDLDYGFGVRERRGSLSIRSITARADLLALARDARGRLRSWIFIPKEERNEALLVSLVTDPVELVPISWGDPIVSSPPAEDDSIAGEYLIDATIEIKEQQKGLAL